MATTMATEFGGELAPQGDERALIRKARDGAPAQYFASKREEAAYVDAQVAAGRGEDNEALVARIETLTAALSVKVGYCPDYANVRLGQAVIGKALAKLQMHSEGRGLTAEQEARVYAD